MQADAEFRHAAELLAAVVERSDSKAGQVIRDWLPRLVEVDRDLKPTLADELARAFPL